MGKTPSYPHAEPFNFLGLEGQTFEKAKVTILPVPYNSTTYWKSGTKDGPQAIIEASRRIELYDIELKKNISEIGIFTLPELEVSKDSPKKTINQIAKVFDQIYEAKKFPLMLGGEHSITLGGLISASSHFNELSVLQIDAHTDSRFEFEGTKYHHACTMRRAVVDLGLTVTHVGIRSTSEEEIEFHKTSKKNFVFFAPAVPIQKIIKTLKKNVYLTFDLDALDTSIMPSTGTPEPGGLGWYETTKFLKAVAQSRKIVAADIVELAPIPGLHAPDFLAAKLTYKLIGYLSNNLH